MELGMKYFIAELRVLEDLLDSAKKHNSCLMPDIPRFEAKAQRIREQLGIAASNDFYERRRTDKRFHDKLVKESDKKVFKHAFSWEKKDEPCGCVDGGCDRSDCMCKGE
ncbi:unnamed protein product [marine sediment metagenome]|uniref:Uncharacterized protein n=1 Tax=marine sediment metagenome TaxID=412755 RepID=X0YX53_9ZZZZ